jgi:ABC-type sugar transport system ATPase subunit
MTTLSLASLSRRYGAATALDGVSLSFHAGEIHALMGENGAGKSTLIRLLAGLERPDAGTMSLDGRPLVFTAPQAAQDAGLRFLHQELHIVPGLSVAENMHLALPFPTRFGLVDWHALRDAAESALSRLGLTHIDPRAPMSRLGPGDRMLTRIAATLIPQPGPAPWLYVLDEPTAALTGPEADRLFATLRDLRKQGAGILYVSHRMAEVMDLSDRITVLRDGRHISTRQRLDTTEAQIIADMTGRPSSYIYPPRVTPAPAPPILALDRVTAPGLSGITLTLAAGEILGLAGLAGSGRGALLAALTGARPHTSGTIMLTGHPYAPRSPADAWARGLALVPRERRAEGLITDATVAENVTLPHLPGTLRNRRAERALTARFAAMTRLKSTGPDQRVTELSGGNQQKVVFARAIAGQPRVLLLDEPTRGVDVGARADIYRLIREACDTGTAVILASSDLPELIGLSDRIAVLHRGRLAHMVAGAGLTEAALLTLCYESAPA